MTDKKTNYSVPLWLLQLPAGKYTIYEMCDITKQKKSNVYMRMRYLEVPKKKAARYGYSYDEYQWQGFDYHIKECWDKINGKSKDK